MACTCAILCQRGMEGGLKEQQLRFWKHVFESGRLGAKVDVEELEKSLQLSTGVPVTLKETFVRPHLRSSDTPDGD